MQNRTEGEPEGAWPIRTIPAGSCSTHPEWCENTEPDHAHHYGTADVAVVRATANPNACRVHGDGLLVPLVQTELFADGAYAASTPEGAPKVILRLVIPDGEGFEESSVEMTPAEADYLRRHLVELLESVGWGVPG